VTQTQQPSWRSVHEAAVFYFTRGFRLVPLFGVDEDGSGRCSEPNCKSRDAGKHEPPASKDLWKDGRVFTPDDFTDQHNIALAMGPVAGAWAHGDWLVALDVDNHTDANAFFYPGLPQTLTQLTPRGAHFVFRVPARTPLGNWVNIFGGAPGTMRLDIRYARGRIVVDPSCGSKAESEGRYRWVHWQIPAELPRHALDAIFDLRRNAGRDMPDQWDRGGKEP